MEAKWQPQQANTTRKKNHLNTNANAEMYNPYVRHLKHAASENYI